MDEEARPRKAARVACCTSDAHAGAGDAQRRARIAERLQRGQGPRALKEQADDDGVQASGAGCASASYGYASGSASSRGVLSKRRVRIGALKSGQSGLADYQRGVARRCLEAAPALRTSCCAQQRAVRAPTPLRRRTRRRARWGAARKDVDRRARRPGARRCLAPAAPGCCSRRHGGGQDVL